jgi:hypothetical protein
VADLLTIVIAVPAFVNVEAERSVFRIVLETFATQTSK